MPSASFIVARTYADKIIGCDNALPWKLKTDLKRFRQLTDGHAVIMGRKTYESIGRPLPNRYNIVLSRERRSSGADGITWASSAEDALFAADWWSICNSKESIFIIGGDIIYSHFERKDLYNRVYLTEVFAEGIKGDAYFRMDFDKRSWKLIEELDQPQSAVDQYPFRFVTYERRQKTVRTRLRSDFLTDAVTRRVEKERLETAIGNWEATHRENSEDVEHSGQLSEQLQLVY